MKYLSMIFLALVIALFLTGCANTEVKTDVKDNKTDTNYPDSDTDGTILNESNDVEIGDMI